MEKFDWIAPMGTNLFMLKIAGMWPLGGTYTANVYAFYTVTCILLFIYGHNFFQTFNIFFILDDMTAVTATIFVALTDLIAIIKTHSMMANVTTLKQILVDINVNMFKPRNEQQKVLVERRIRLWKTVYGLFCFMAFFTILFWGIYPILDRSVKEYRLPFLAWYPYDTKVSPYYEVTYVYQIASVAFIALANLHIDTLTAALMMVISSQCDILCDELASLHLKEDVDGGFMDCITHHREILKLAATLNQFFNIIVFTQFFTSAISIGLTMFQLTVVAPLSTEFYSLLFYGSAIVVQIFMYCWFGNEVEVTSQNIPYAACAFDWTDVSLELKKNLIFFIARTQRPLRMSAFNLFYLTLDTFTRILRTSWSYFAVLHQINRK